MKGLIYIATDTDNGKVYIGQTVQGLVTRKAEHYQDASRESSNQFHKAISEHSFTWDVLDEFEGTKEYVIHALNVAEEYQIIKHKSADADYGYNSTFGGYSSDKFAEHIKARLDAYNGGKALLQYSLEGVFIKEFPTINSVAVEYGKGKLKSCNIVGEGHCKYGYQWRVKESEDYPKYIGPYSPDNGVRDIRIAVYSGVDGSMVGIYDNVDQVVKMSGDKRDYVLFSSSANSAKGYKLSVLWCNVRRFIYYRVSDDLPAKLDYTVIEKKVKPLGRPTEKRAVIQYDSKGNRLAEYESTRDACRISGCARKTIVACCRMSEPIKFFSWQTKYVWRYKSADGKDIFPKIEFVDRKEKVVSTKRHTVYQFDKSGKCIGNYKNIRVASEVTGESASSIRKICFGRKVTCSKFWWSYETEMDSHIMAMLSSDYEEGSRPTAVCQCHKDGTFIKEYKNPRIASESTGDSPGLIRKMCLGGKTNKTKYLWIYRKDIS